MTENEKFWSDFEKMTFDMSDIEFKNTIRELRADITKAIIHKMDESEYEIDHTFEDANKYIDQHKLHNLSKGN